MSYSIEVKAVANHLKWDVKHSGHGIIDVGNGVENLLLVSKKTLYSAIELLKKQGFKVFLVQLPMASSKNGATVETKLLCDPEWTGLEEQVLELAKAGHVDPPRSIGLMMKYRELYSTLAVEKHIELTNIAKNLKDRGFEIKEIGQIMNLPESSVRKMAYGYTKKESDEE